jgi:hypothetical protein
LEHDNQHDDSANHNKYLKEEREHLFVQESLHTKNTNFNSMSEKQTHTHTHTHTHIHTHKTYTDTSNMSPTNVS